MIPLQVRFSGNADEDLERMDASLQKFFISHAEKISQMPPRRHMKHGVPHYIENVTRQARLVYTIENETLWVIRCFATHEEYERWFKSFK